jgi:hypothetical protein
MNYSGLLSSVASFLNRQDLTAVIPTFVQLCEADLNRTVRHRSMLARATATLNDQFIALPQDYLEAKNIQLNTSPVTSLEFLSMELADEARIQHSSAGQPKWYTLVADTIEVVPTPSQDYTVELVYYKKLTALSDSDTSNWLLSSHPDVYLYGTLMQSAPYLKDDERISVWGPLYKQFVADLNSASDRAEYSGSLLKMRTKWP